MSMGGGGGKGKSSTESPAASALADLATQFAGETAPARKGLLSAMQEVLQTGGSKIPIVSRSVEQSLQSGSKALASTEEDLARKDLAGTPFGAETLAKTRREGQQAAGQTGEALAQAIFNLIPNFILGQSQTALSGLSGAIPGMQSSKESGKGMGFNIGG